MSFKRDPRAIELWEAWTRMPHPGVSGRLADEGWQDDLTMLDGEVGHCLDLIFAPALPPAAAEAAMRECDLILRSGVRDLGGVVSRMEGPELEYFGTLRDILKLLLDEA